MPIKRRASTILGAFEKAQADLVGKPWCWPMGRPVRWRVYGLIRIARLANLNQGPRWEVACLDRQICGELACWPPSECFRRTTGLLDRLS